MKWGLTLQAGAGTKVGMLQGGQVVITQRVAHQGHASTAAHLCTAAANMTTHIITSAVVEQISGS